MANRNALVLDGAEIKYRLEAARTAHRTPVHVDWVRFTSLRRNVVPLFLSPAEQLPSFGSDSFADMPPVVQREVITNLLKAMDREHDSPEFSVAMREALDLAKEVCIALGPLYTINPKLKGGRDFYKHLWSIERNGAECAWVGFLAASTSPSKLAQDATIHVNIYGAACTFAAPGWSNRIADIIDMHDAKLTRADLALDFFDGLPNGRTMESIKSEWIAGDMNCRGQRPKHRMIGGWSCDEFGGERSFYIGSKEAGKETNIYEKGHQLFGLESKNPWVRIELRYGNKLRVLASDMLRRPADFFAGASDWHSLQLLQADCIASPQQVPTHKTLAIQSVEAEVTRVLRWAERTAGPTLTALVKFATESALFEICEHKAKPGRLQKFSDSELSTAFHSVFSRTVKKPFYMIKDHGTTAMHSIFSVGGSSPIPV